jgi:hypothetical protein
MQGGVGVNLPALIGRGNFPSDQPYEMGPSGTSTKKGNQNLKRLRVGYLGANLGFQLVAKMLPPNCGGQCHDSRTNPSEMLLIAGLKQGLIVNEYT